MRPKLLETDSKMQALTQELLTERAQYDNLEAEYRGSSEEMQIIIANITMERDQLESALKETQVNIDQCSFVHIEIFLYTILEVLECKV